MFHWNILVRPGKDTKPRSGQSDKTIEPGSLIPPNDVKDRDIPQPDDDTSSINSDSSKASTIEYRQESYATFKDKALKLSLDFFPGHGPKDVTLERMNGGGYNRVVGLATPYLSHSGVTKTNPLSDPPWPLLRSSHVQMLHQQQYNSCL